VATLAQDPTYLAYLRAIGMEQTEAIDSAESKRGAIEDRLALYKPELKYQGQVERRNVSGGFENRGIFQSSDHERALAEQRHGEQFKIGQLEQSGAEELTGIQTNLAMQLARLERDRAEKDLALSQSIYTNEGVVPYQNP
jgi:hypothetical protein